MGTPQTLDDLDLVLPGAETPSFLFFSVEGTAEQLPKRIARMLQFYGFTVVHQEKQEPEVKE